MELNKTKLLELYPPYDSVLGPYTRSDGRQHIVLNNTSVPHGTKDKTRTISYPKAIVESNIDDRLLPEETVDHRNRDFNDNDSTNLAIKERSLHYSEDALRVAISDVTCIGCGKTFTPTVEQIKTRSNGKVGPFCSRQCSGRYGAQVQNGGKKLGRQEIRKVLSS